MAVFRLKMKDVTGALVALATARYVANKRPVAITVKIQPLARGVVGSALSVWADRIVITAVGTSPEVARLLGLLPRAGTKRILLAINGILQEHGIDPHDNEALLAFIREHNPELAEKLLEHFG